ncbi:hypothetical protein [Fictibacillus sp. NRS-1165]|uniref:hypothetical protein n=1 Tax=Fictibacillus sp. NRS-1165 TaxID=3144463 RepID=UPI003D21A4FB
MKRIAAFLIVFAIAFVTAFSFWNKTASASVPRFAFKTEDGKWDGSIYNPNSHSNLKIDLVHPLYVNGTKKLTDTSKLKVRLCNAQTKACTAFKTLKIDVRDSISNTQVSGKLDIIYY